MDVNALLVQNGCGVLTIIEPHMAQFNEKLSTYYETGDGQSLKKFLYDYAVSGIEFDGAVLDTNQ